MSMSIYLFIYLHIYQSIYIRLCILYAFCYSIRPPSVQVAATLEGEGVPGTVPVIAGLSNVYTHYITTWEEYQVQRYEAASTIYGPHTCSAYMQQYSYLAAAMVKVLPKRL